MTPLASGGLRWPRRLLGVRPLRRGEPIGPDRNRQLVRGLSSRHRGTARAFSMPPSNPPSGCRSPARQPTSWTVGGSPVGRSNSMNAAGRRRLFSGAPGRDGRAAPLWRSRFVPHAVAAGGSRLELARGFWAIAHQNRGQNLTGAQLRESGSQVVLPRDGRPLDVNHLVSDLTVTLVKLPQWAYAARGERCRNFARAARSRRPDAQRTSASQEAD